MFRAWLENSVYISSLESVAPLLSQWFTGGFMHGKQNEEIVTLLQGFELLKQLSPVTSPMTLFRVQPLERNIHTIIKINLNIISSWCESAAHARSFYYQFSSHKNSPVRLKSHAIIKSKFQPEEILVVTNQLLPKLEEFLEKLPDDNFPIRLGNVYHNMNWHEYQREVIVHAPGLCEVEVIEWLP